ncbi:hypothetical protein [Candidatus Enterococcus clewellii]|uniref:DUF2178 domain-containing protein n=1 Tax=Candidatus Enterococcus clewellii TaxID=1834193 RepID=A0A242KB84_9ENTE|nr:hypothetical protein [Enterococcus sp. 9E7_DIV0242]OTP18435.1 hypothetical protein A5888_000249 [Enterococcus sp. 9E7_DIV0242]
MKFGMKFNGGQNKDYKRTLQNRKRLFVGMIVVGAIISALSFLLLKSGGHEASYTNGFGVGLIAIGIILSFKNKQMLDNKEKMEKNKREEFDERNIAINNQALITAVRVFILLLVLITIITAFVKPIYSVIFATMISTYLLLYLAAYIYHQRKM